MTSISGVWKFNDVITEPQYCDFGGGLGTQIIANAIFNFTNKQWSDKLCDRIIYSRTAAVDVAPTSSLSVGYYNDSNSGLDTGYVFEENYWRYGVATLDFGETPQEVTDDFYAWFTTNAKRVTKKFTQLYKGKTVSTIGSYAFKMLRKSADDDAGLYDANDNLIASWYELTTTYGMDCKRGYTAGNYDTHTTSPYYVLHNNEELSKGVKLILGGISQVGKMAFYMCKKLNSITLPDGVTYIGDDAFYGCSGLTSITIPASVVVIESFAFAHCKSLTSVTFAEESQLLAIGGYVFTDTRLASIIIPKRVSRVGSGFVQDCPSLHTIYCEANAPGPNWHEYWNWDGVRVVWGYKP